MSKIVKVGVLKAGCIGSLPLIEFLLDERADREDIQVKVIGSGAKVTTEQCIESAEQILKYDVDLIIFIGPAQTTQGPSEARRILRVSNKPVIVVSDSPAKRIIKELDESGFGYIIVEADSMIGARREFLDPAEMALYNSDIIKVLAVTGVLNLIVSEIDRVIDAIKSGGELNLPRLIIDGKRAVEAAGFSNPYARAKAMAAYELAKQVSTLTFEACFKVQEPETYIPLVAAAHEIMRTAAKLADEAREIEKKNDSVLRRPHFRDGSRGEKRLLMERPRRPVTS
ncbi:MAG: F420-dependent methylenetetrahydromethanopterin dehydrogenase [Candidatus Bathyarchaeia archaeon]|nr:F420-dependent methylenetetrahydromethanopterin dehydrogenase [Candidatus Bathyarchaeota archaeon]